MNLILCIKNMVCPRCIIAVEKIFNQLNIDYSTVNLGEVIIDSKLSISKRDELSKHLQNQGFELLEDVKAKTINQIKSIIIEQIHQQNEMSKVNLSTVLTEALNQEYTQLSKLFSSVEGVTIEKFVVKQKIERAKELLFYNEMTLSQIANELTYSSVAHLSNQFKKETGMTPSAFKKDRNLIRKSLDKI